VHLHLQHAGPDARADAGPDARADAGPDPYHVQLQLNDRAVCTGSTWHAVPGRLYHQLQVRYAAQLWPAQQHRGMRHNHRRVQRVRRVLQVLHHGPGILRQLLCCARRAIRVWESDITKLTRRRHRWRVPTAPSSALK
jgi:hypothetical protein